MPIERLLQANSKRLQKMLRDNRMVCGARRRSDGQPCQALSVAGKLRCKWHGGCSTGPRTAEGKAVVAANLRKVTCLAEK